MSIVLCTISWYAAQLQSEFLFFDNYAGFWERVLHLAFLHLIGKTKFSLVLKCKQWSCVLYSSPAASNSWYVMLERQCKSAKNPIYHAFQQNAGLKFSNADECLHPISNGIGKCLCILHYTKAYNSIDHHAENFHSSISTVVLQCNKDLTVSENSSNSIPSRYYQEYSTVPHSY